MTVAESIVHDCTFEEYRQLPGLNFSTAKWIRKCPLAMAVVERGGSTPPTSPMIMGQAVHTAVLEPDEFDGQYMRGPEGTRRGTKAWKEAEAKRPRARLLKPEEYNEITSIQQSVLNCPEAVEALTGGWAETSITWTDDETGMDLKCRIDKATLVGSNGKVIDLKTTTDASPWTMGRRMVTSPYYYLIQMAFYARGFTAAFGGVVPEAMIIAVEKSPGNPVGVYDIAASDMEIGQRMLTEMLTEIKQHREDGTMESHYERQFLPLPNWFYEQEQTE